MSENLEAIRERLNESTPGPWVFDGDVVQDLSLAVSTGPNKSERVGIVPGEYVRENDAELIAHAPTDLAHMLAIIDRVERLADYWERTPALRRGTSAADLRAALRATS
ncbi:hypothetical protein [Pseudarthrobacter sp. LMD1-1-1.1]|uniref:hypothetical protein n=1 Tax=Pseudarthrobacter sp. LMD1-1-1.1 TaxID=3135242 RepID=UPI00343F23BA